MMTQRVLKMTRPRNTSAFQQIRVPINEDNHDINVFVKWTVNFRVSANESSKSGNFSYRGPANELRLAVDDKIAEYLGQIPEMYEILNVQVELTDQQNRQVNYDYASNRMLSNEPFDISVNIFSNVIQVKPTEENCVKTFLRKHYPKISNQSKDPIGKLGNDQGVSTHELVEFCKQYKIRMVAYNIKKEVIAHYNPPKNDKKYAALYFISYNNHMYPIKNKYLEQFPKTDKFEYMEPSQLNDTFTDLLKSNILPDDIRLDNNQITSFKHSGIQYFTNDQYKQCYEVMRQYGFQDKIKPTTKYTNILYELEKAYTEKSLNSFFPIRHTKLPFWYNKERNPSRAVETIDKNKAYSSILKNLPYLLSVDYRTTPIQDFPFKLTEHALYIATPEIPNILMPKQDIYTGRHLLYCKGKINFTLQEKLEASHQPNVYRHIIQDLYEKCDPNVVKQIVVRTIGTYQSEPEIKEGSKVYVVNEQERNTAFDAIPFGDYYLEIQKQSYVSSLYNRKPIAIQIKDQMNVLLYEKMKELHLTNDDIVQINTDSITYYTSPEVKPVTQNTLDGWKFSNYTEKQGTIFDNDEPFTTMKQLRPNNNTLVTGYAGNGKSYYIQNELDLTNSIILSSKHSAIVQHRDKGLNSQVIQYYQFTNTVPVEDHIIVEEIGILDRPQWDILFKCFLLGKKLTCLGDFQQLLPACETSTFSSPPFLNMMFSTQLRKETNYRNNFTPEYYKSLIESTDPNYLKQEIEKYSTAKPEEAEVIIAYRNDIVDKYNNYMLQYHNKTINDPDVPMICKTNELRDKNIYNGFVLKSQDIDPDDKKHFKPAYARTLYNIQGDETRSYYMAPEDLHWFSKNREAYTLISRLTTRR